MVETPSARVATRSERIVWDFEGGRAMVPLSRDGVIFHFMRCAFQREQNCCSCARSNISSLTSIPVHSAKEASPW
jgi:hypothetical protein